MATKKKNKKEEITAGSIVRIHGRVIPDNKKEATSDYEDYQATVLSVTETDMATIRISYYNSKTITATTWLGNLRLVCNTPKYSIGDIVALKPLVIKGIDIDEDCYDSDDDEPIEPRYEIHLGDDSVYIKESEVSQLMSQGLA